MSEPVSIVQRNFRVSLFCRCLRIVSDYPTYSVQLSGVGDPPEGREEVGHCSQMALFTRDDSDVCANNTVGTPYNIVS